MKTGLDKQPIAGFSFDNYDRNLELIKKGFQPGQAVKTGTTIAGVVFADGVVLGADTRSTMGSIVADKNCSKIHHMAPNIYCCGAGTAADCDYVTRMIASQLELHKLNTGKLVPVVAAETIIKQYLFRYQGYVSAALILGGYDETGGQLYQIYPHGSSDSLPFVTMGSGSLAAVSVLETGWKPNMNAEEAKKLVKDAICGGIFNDLGSGSNVDLCVITKAGAQYLRPYEVANVKGVRQGNYDYPSGSSRILTSVSQPIIVEETMVREVEPAEPDAMDTSS